MQASYDVLLLYRLDSSFSEVAPVDCMEIISAHNLQSISAILEKRSLEDETKAETTAWF